LNTAKIWANEHSFDVRRKKNFDFVPKGLVYLEKKFEKKMTEGVPPVIYAA